MHSLRELLQYREFLVQTILQQMRSRYRGSVLGFLWTLLNPLLTVAILSVIFSYINNWDLKTFGLFFFSGYVPWLFFCNSASMATGAIVGNHFYVTKIYVPRLVFPLAVVALNLVDLGVSLMALLALAFLVGAHITAAWIWLPVSIVLTVLFTIGVSLLFAAATVFLRDFQFLWSNLSMMLFFFSPILFTLERIPPSARPYFELNPILPFLRLFQNPIFDGRAPAPETLALATAQAVVSLLLGYGVFVRAQRSFYLYL
jgi:ABC-type polysaccharide/polyol phosphate export permease